MEGIQSFWDWKTMLKNELRCCCSWRYLSTVESEGSSTSRPGNELHCHTEKLQFWIMLITHIIFYACRLTLEPGPWVSLAYTQTSLWSLLTAAGLNCQSLCFLSYLRQWFMFPDAPLPKRWRFIPGIISATVCTIRQRQREWGKGAKEKDIDRELSLTIITNRKRYMLIHNIVLSQMTGLKHCQRCGIAT